MNKICSSNMNIQPLLSTPERARILKHVMDDPGRVSRVSNTARELNIAKGLVSSFFQTLENQGLVVEKKPGIVTNLSSPTARVIKMLINIEKIDIKPLLSLKPLGVGLYGSWARGTNTPKCPVDIWVTTRNKVRDEAVAEAKAELSRAIGSEVRLLVLDKQRIAAAKNDPAHYHSLLHGMILYGDSLEDEK